MTSVRFIKTRRLGTVAHTCDSGTWEERQEDEEEVRLLLATQ